MYGCNRLTSDFIKVLSVPKNVTFLLDEERLYSNKNTSHSLSRAAHGVLKETKFH
jgi:hypothetical protein